MVFLVSGIQVFGSSSDRFLAGTKVLGYKTFSSVLGRFLLDLDRFGSKLIEPINTLKKFGYRYGSILFQVQLYLKYRKI